MPYPADFFLYLNEVCDLTELGLCECQSFAAKLIGSTRIEEREMEGGAYSEQVASYQHLWRY